MILKKLAQRDFQLNRKRSWGTIIGITLSVALIMAVATMVASFRQTMIDRAVKNGGYYHLELMNLTDRQLEKVSQNRDFKKPLTYGYVGVAEFKHHGDQYDESPNLAILSTVDAKPQQVGYHLLQGRWAANNHEIAVSQETIADSNYRLGDWLDIKVGQAVSGEVVDDPGDKDGTGRITHPAEQVVKSQPARYQITGIIEQPTVGYHYYGLTARAAVNRTNAYLILQQPRHYRRDIPEILGLASYRQVQELKKSRYMYGVNTSLLHWQVFAFSDSNIQSLLWVSGVVLAIILLTSIFCIRNSFAIATTEKTKMYGMLASVGATKRQIRQTVLAESLLLGIIGIPAGLLLGTLAAGILGQVINTLGSQIIFHDARGFHFSFSWLGLVVAIVLGILTIYLSALSSARRASRVSPIDQLRNRQAVTLTAKKLRTPKRVKRVFKMGGVMAYKNLRRSRKKYRTTVTSIAVSIGTFIAMTAFINTAFATTGRYYQNHDYNLIVDIGNQGTSREQLNDVASLPTVKKMRAISIIDRMNQLKIQNRQHFNTKNKSIGDAKELNLDLIAVDHASFQELVKQQKLTPANSTGSLLFDESDSSGTGHSQRSFNYQAGDQIAASLRHAGKKHHVKFKLGGVLKSVPNWLYMGSSGTVLILDQDKYPRISGLSWSPNQLVLKATKNAATSTKIKSIIPGVSIEDFDAQVKEERAMRLLFSIFLYGFILVIILIGVTNIFNTITANMELRQREFAVLKSVGMTKKEFNQLINLETLFYCTKSLLIGIAGGLVGSALIYIGFNGNSATPVSFQLPIKAILISTVAVFALVYLIMRYSLNKINRQNIIETIRRENI
ncbi:ABC transporter permease [Lapidilactobacillus wuchangensis]|uniref:ABC transporter permease n=1 Tax=Lapidilactobacillus wuchangensis TaxID=2486001 RepID=UPI000F773B30|nr:ABC transporter permease [Lapidilactobacillus wuchangensis]